jgi:hypothetical protein
VSVKTNQHCPHGFSDDALLVRLLDSLDSLLTLNDDADDSLNDEADEAD